jgi:hypothetical protein
MGQYRHPPQLLSVSALTQNFSIDSLRIVPTSSPGTDLTRSPTCTIPLHNRPETATPDATAV